jgi:uncharacterized membrane protein (UPF0127 family)
MLRVGFGCLLLAMAATMACSRGDDSEDMLQTRSVTLPDGFVERAELKITPSDMARGMMYRDSLANGNGMLFVHQDQSRSPYWMANCKFPLDIIWMDSNRKVVEISAATPPCPGGGRDCPQYGGHYPAQFVLEIGGGEAARHQVREGVTLQF